MRTPNTGRPLPRIVWLGVACIVAAGMALVYLEIQLAASRAPDLKRSGELVARTYHVLGSVQAFGSAVKDAEDDLRGFLIAGAASYLDAYHADVNRARILLSTLKQETIDNAEQQKRWPVLEAQMNARIAALEAIVDAYAKHGLDDARQAALLDSGRQTTDTIAADIDAATAAERDLLAQRQAQVDRDEEVIARTAVISGILACLLMALGTFLVLHAFRSMQRADAARDRSERNFLLFVNGVTDHAIFTLDPQGIITSWNTGAERIKGYTADEAIGQHFSIFYTEEERRAERPRQALERALALGKFEDDGFRVRKDGSTFHASVMIETIRDASKQVVGFAKITRDVSEKAMHQEALLQYQKMDALGQLTGGIAHDFNNLVHVIKNATEILLHRLPDAKDDIRVYLDMLKRNADRAANLTNRLLAYSRRQVLDPKPVHPRTLVNDVTGLFRHAVGEGIAIETVLGAGLWSISVDATQLETALLNLALNARDAMPDGGKLTLEISNAYLDENYAAVYPELRAGQYVMFAVTDSGHGMSKEVADKAFDPFFTTKEIGQGTGLGLSQVWGFIKQSGGHAKIYSEIGVGTTVKVYLPREYGGVTDSGEGKPRLPPRGGRRETILVVEDDDDVREFTVGALEELGYNVRAVHDATAALETLHADPDVALLFTDVGLPNGINGRMLANEAVARYPSLRVLFTTGYARNAIIHNGHLDPGVELIAKPFTQLELAERVRRLLDA